MKFADVLRIAVAGNFLAADKKPEDLQAAVFAADKAAKDKKAKDSEGYEREAALDEREEAMDSAEEKSDAGKTDKEATDRKGARDARKGARDARKGARDKRAKDAETDPENTNDNELEQAETGTPSKGGKSQSGAMDSAEVDRRIAAAVAARDELHTATHEVEPIVGVRAFDSAGDAYKAALESLKVDIQGVPPSAYRTVFKIAKDSRTSAPPPAFAMDQGTQAETLALIPHLNRL